MNWTNFKKIYEMSKINDWLNNEFRWYTLEKIIELKNSLNELRF